MSNYNGIYGDGGQFYRNTLGDIILAYANVCGVFTKEQAYLMVPDKHYTSIDKVLKGLKTSRRVFSKEGDYYTMNPIAPIDYNMLRCLWVLLDFKEDCIPNTQNFLLAPSVKPSFITCVRNNIAYDIVPINAGEAATILLLDGKYAAENEHATSDEVVHKFILAVPNKSVVTTLPVMKAPHIFAVVNELPMSERNYDMKKICEVEYWG